MPILQINGKGWLKRELRTCHKLSRDIVCDQYFAARENRAFEYVFTYTALHTLDDQALQSLAYRIPIAITRRKNLANSFDVIFVLPILKTIP